jgi:hypothetical protein
MPTLRQLWQIECNLSPEQISKKIVGDTVLTKTGVLYLKSGRITALTLPAAYAEEPCPFDMETGGSEDMVYNGQTLKLLRNDDKFRVAVRVGSKQGTPWLYQFWPNSDRLYGSAQLQESFVPTVSYLTIDSQHLMVSVESYRELHSLQETHLYLLNPLRRAPLGFRQFSDLSRPHQGVIATGSKETLEGPFDTPLTLVDPYTGHYKWQNADYRGGYWIGSRWILAQRLTKTSIQWDLLDGKTGKPLKASIPPDLKSAEGLLWTSSNYVIRFKNGNLYGYQLIE